VTWAPVLDRDRLGKLLGMLGSDHDGEVTAAARKANEMVRNAGMTWTEILAPSPALPSPKYDVADGDIVGACRFCLRWPEAITDWEEGFLSSLLVRRRPLSEKQWKERVEKFASAAYSS
jgi:hypothetical protein